MKKNRLDARMIAIMGLLIALMVTLSRLVSIETPFVKISVTFIPQMIMGILFGPFWSGIGGVLADLVGMALFYGSVATRYRVLLHQSRHDCSYSR